MSGHPTSTLCVGPFSFTAGNIRGCVEQLLQHTPEFPCLFLNQVKALPAKPAWQRSVGKAGLAHAEASSGKQSSPSSSHRSFPGGDFSKTLSKAAGELQHQESISISNCTNSWWGEQHFGAEPGFCVATSKLTARF